MKVTWSWKEENTNLADHYDICWMTKIFVEKILKQSGERYVRTIQQCY